MIFDSLIIGAGQAGLATAFHLENAGLDYLALNAGPEATGSWPRYYDSLRLFSPAAYAGLPGMPFPGPADRYPARDEVVAYLRAYRERFSLRVRNHTKVVRVSREDETFEVHTADGEVLRASSIVAATGSFNTPFVPDLPGRATFGGEVLHAIDYRSPAAFASKRVLVVGAANTAVQIAHELAAVSETTLAVRDKVRFAPQRILGKDFHFWLWLTGLDKTSWLRDQSTPVLDTGVYRRALRAGSPDQRRMFTAFTESGVRWADGAEEPVDVVIFATGYRPNLPYLAPLGVNSPSGVGTRAGISENVPGLYFVGFSGQRSFSSATLRGVGRDAAHVVKHLRRRLDRLGSGRSARLPGDRTEAHTAPVS